MILRKTTNTLPAYQDKKVEKLTMLAKDNARKIKITAILTARRLRMRA